MDDIVVQALRAPSIVWCILIGIYSALASARLPSDARSVILNVVNVLLVVSVTAAAASLSRATLGYSLRKNKLAIPATGLSLTAVTAMIWIVGGLVLLSGLGVSITPILTALGVGGLAVALALQETLSNFVAGLHLLLENSRISFCCSMSSGNALSDASRTKASKSPIPSARCVCERIQNRLRTSRRSLWVILP